MDYLDKDSILRLLESNPDRIEIIEVTDDSVTYFDQKLEKEYTARLIDPSPEWLDSLIHVLPLAEGKTPGKDVIVGFLMSIDPAMLTCLSGIYVRGGVDDDNKLAEKFDSQAEAIAEWDDPEGKGRNLGWFWADENAVVINMEAIIREAGENAKEAFPDVPDIWETECDKIIFEQFFLTLAHEIRHLAVDFPLIHEYCRIYGDVKRGEMPDGVYDPEVLEEDAENWAVDAFNDWLATFPSVKPQIPAENEEEPGITFRP